MTSTHSTDTSRAIAEGDQASYVDDDGSQRSGKITKIWPIGMYGSPTEVVMIAGQALSINAVQKI